MSDVVIVQPEPDDGTGTENNEPVTEGVTDEAIEAVADSSTEIAQIQANAQVEIAQIQADVEHDRIGVVLETTLADKDKEIEQCRLTIAGLTSDLASTKEQLSLIQMELETLKNPATEALVEESVEVTPDSQEAPVEPPRVKSRRHRWI